MRQIDHIMQTLDFPRNLDDVFDEGRMENIETFGDSLLKTLLIEKLLRENPEEKNLQTFINGIVPNRVLSDIFDDLDLGSYFGSFNLSIKAKADIIEMILGLAFFKVGLEFAREVHSYFFDMLIYNLRTDIKNRTGNFEATVAEQCRNTPNVEEDDLPITKEPSEELKVMRAKFKCEWNKRMAPLRPSVTMSMSKESLFMNVSCNGVGNTKLFTSSPHKKTDKELAAIEVMQMFLDSDLTIVNVSEKIIQKEVVAV